MWADSAPPQDGWQKVRFDDLAASVTDRVDDPSTAGVDRYVGLEHLDSDSLDIRRWGAPDEVEATKLRFRRDDLVFGRRRAYQRKLALADFEGICSAHALVLRPKRERVAGSFLAHLMRTDAFYERALAISVGSMSPTINWKTLAGQELYVPSPEAQLHIVRVLDAAYDHVRKLQRAYEAALVARAVLKRSLFVDVQAPGWSRSTVGEHFICQSGATPKRSEHRYFDDGTTPWVKTLDLTEGDVVATDENITDAALAETSCRLMPPGTVMVAMYGGFRQIGRTGILRVEAATNQAVCCMSPRGEAVLPEYLLHSLQANRAHWRNVAASSRKDPNITKRDVEEFALSVPPTLDEQRALIGRVQEQDRLVTALHEALNAAKELERGLANAYIAEGGSDVH